MSNYNLERFISAQKNSFEIALAEIKSGKKKSCWMWFVFPQLKALGQSSTAVYYGIENLDEAYSYMENDYLRNNLITITKALLSLKETNPGIIMGYPDNLKLCSSMTLFEIAAPDVSEFTKILEKFYNGQRDEKTLNILNIK